MKLSANLIHRYTALAMHCGEDFGLYPHMEFKLTNAHLYWTDILTIDGVLSEGSITFAYSLWIDEDFFYICIASSIYQVKRVVHGALGIEEIVLFIYLVFVKHQTFNL